MLPELPLRSRTGRRLCHRGLQRFRASEGSAAADWVMRGSRSIPAGEGHGVAPHAGAGSRRRESTRDQPIARMRPTRARGPSSVMISRTPGRFHHAVCPCAASVLRMFLHLLMRGVAGSLPIEPWLETQDFRRNRASGCQEACPTFGRVWKGRGREGRRAPTTHTALTAPAGSTTIVALPSWSRCDLASS